MFGQTKLSRRRFLKRAAAAIAATPSGTISFAQGRASRELSSLASASAWLNSPPLSAAALDKKVVLIEFWTYSCINWRRQLPYVRAWSEKYKDRGFVVIGAHSPEFSFEKNLDNVRWALKDMKVDYPIAVDNDFAIWRAFGNAYWPALYFIDAQGRVRHQVFGEGEYEQSERMIQKLLAENGVGETGTGLVSVDALGAEAPADWRELKSGENYLGYQRTQNFASGRAAADRRRAYSVPACDSMPGVFPAIGQWVGKRSCRTRRMRISGTVFTPATFISSWGRRQQARRCDLESQSMGKRPEPLTASTSTTRETASWRSRGCINLSVNRPRSSIASSTSRFSIRVWKPTL